MEVTQVRRVRGIWYITLGGETLRIPRSLYEERPIAEGDEIDPEEYDQWLLLRQYRPGLEYAVSLLAQRPYAEGELEARMLRLGYRLDWRKKGHAEYRHKHLGINATLDYNPAWSTCSMEFRLTDKK
jgi:hypothetical protein